MYNVITIAEIGENHVGDMAVAKDLIKKAAEAEVDYVKFQSYRPETFKADDPEYAWFKKVSLTDKDHFSLKECAEHSGVKFLSSPFSLERAKFLHEKLKLKEIKIASGMMMDFELLSYCNQHFDKVFISTGLATYEEIKKAVSSLNEVKDLYILHCVTQYPLIKENANLNTITRLRQLFPGKKIGYSDHTIGTLACLVAASLGAEAIEKHFTLNKNAKEGTDHVLSVEPDELKLLIAQIRDISIILGDAVNKPALCEKEVIKFVRERFKK